MADVDMSDTLSAPAKAKCKTPGKGSKAGSAASEGGVESKKRFEVKKVRRHFRVLDRLAWL
jgi:hypothetical protein